MSISEKLKQRMLFKKRCELRADAPAFINESVRQLILCMRLHEVSGIMSREQLERCVMAAFEDAEAMYYGMDDESVMALARMEMKNAEGRARHNKGL